MRIPNVLRRENFEPQTKIPVRMQWLEQNHCWAKRWESPCELRRLPSQSRRYVAYRRTVDSISFQRLDSCEWECQNLWIPRKRHQLRLRTWEGHRGNSRQYLLEDPLHEHWWLFEVYHSNVKLFLPWWSSGVLCPVRTMTWYLVLSFAFSRARDGGSFAEILSDPSYNEVCGCKHVHDETACYIVKRCGVTMSGTVILMFVVFWHLSRLRRDLGVPALASFTCMPRRLDRKSTYYR